MRTLQQLVRSNIWNLNPRDYMREHTGEKPIRVRLDANECPYNSPFNRYPDSRQLDLRRSLSKVKNVAANEICVANGKDEIVCNLFLCFCEPARDNVVAIHPTCGMYKMWADINNVEYRKAMLGDGFQMSAEKILDLCDGNTKIVWICSPNVPTGNLMSREEMELLLDCFDGIVVVDETYADFVKARPFRSDLHRYRNLVSIDSMDAAWASAAIRLGMAYADKDIIAVLDKVKAPYGVNVLTQKRAIDMLADAFDVEKWASTIRLERQRMMEAFAMLPFCVKVYGSDANFFLAQVDDADKVYEYLLGQGIAVCNCNNVAGCGNCLRITVGSKSENNELLAALRKY